jgi:signal peptidase I
MFFRRGVFKGLLYWLAPEKWGIIKIMLEKGKIKGFVIETVITLVIAIAIFIGARLTIQTYEVFQTSMLPNFQAGERVVVNKAVYWFREPRRGDVVIINAPNGDEPNWIKRIIGLPGDTVEIVHGVTYVNGLALNEPYVVNSFTYSLAKRTLAPDNYFFLGDNRDVSNDSSKGWLITHKDIIGKAWLISWPPSEWSTVPEYNLDKQVGTTVGTPTGVPDSAVLPATLP